MTGFSVIDDHFVDITEMIEFLGVHNHIADISNMVITGTRAYRKIILNAKMRRTRYETTEIKKLEAPDLPPRSWTIWKN
jgi:hypothetical protein